MRALCHRCLLWGVTLTLSPPMAMVGCIRQASDGAQQQQQQRTSCGMYSIRCLSTRPVHMWVLVACFIFYKRLTDAGVPGGGGKWERTDMSDGMESGLAIRIW